MDAISRASGVSKATIYNHWADKEALLLEVMLFVHGLDRKPENVDTGDLTSDLAIILNRKPPSNLEETRLRITPSLIAYSAVHPEFGKQWRWRVMEPPRNCLEAVLKRWIERGVLPPTLDMGISMALLLGPKLYAHIFEKSGARSDRDLGQETAAAFVRAFANRSK